MKKYLIFVFIALIQARLYRRQDVEQFQNVFQSYNDVTSVTTSCNVVDATKLGAKLPTGQVVYAGYLNTDDKQQSGLSYIFYGSQLATSSQDLSKYPTIIWLNGGPGSSSQLGNFLELGPIWIKEDGSFYVNQNSWNTLYNLMIVDQPVGVGFGFAASLTDIPVNQDEVGQQFLHAWTQFLTDSNGCVKQQKLDGLLKSPWFVFGESYAGKYVPSIAEAVLKSTKISIPLKGIGIGDGFTDPLSVISEMPGFGYNLGLTDYQERKDNEAQALGGVINIKKQDWLAAQQSFDIVADFIVEQSGEVNIYNIFVNGDYSSTEKPVFEYLNSDATKTLFGFNTAIEFNLGNDDVYNALSIDFMKSDCVARVEYVLTKIPVLIYNGQNDLIVPNPATSRWVYALNYANSADYRKADFTPWLIEKKVVGYKKTAGNLEYRIVNQAGHLVPMDQPVSALDMLRSFVEQHK